MFDRKQSMPRSSVMKVAFTGSFAVTFILVLARTLGILPMPQDLTLAGAIGLCAALTPVMVATSAWYLVRTDEHDLHANLWSMSWAWIAGALIAVDWAILHAAGFAPVPDAIAILLASAVVAVAGWVWLRFR